MRLFARPVAVVVVVLALLLAAVGWPRVGNALVALGTLGLAAFAFDQSRRERERARRAERPSLIVTGGCWDRGICRIEFWNFSRHPVVVDGIYADWHTPEGDQRLDFENPNPAVSFHRTVLAPGGHITRFHPFPMEDRPGISGKAPNAGKFTSYTLTSAVWTASVFYPLSGAERIEHRWRVENVDGVIRATPLEG